MLASVGVFGGDRAVADVRRLAPFGDDDVPERLDLPSSDRLGEHPVLAGLRNLELGDEDRTGVRLVRALDPDRLRRRSRLEERLPLEAAREPDACLRPRHDLSLTTDHEEGEAHGARREVSVPGNDRDVFAGRPPERLERAGRRFLHRFGGGAAAAGGEQEEGENEGEDGRAWHAASVAAAYALVAVLPAAEDRAEPTAADGEKRREPRAAERVAASSSLSPPFFLRTGCPGAPRRRSGRGEPPPDRHRGEQPDRRARPRRPRDG